MQEKFGILEMLNLLTPPSAIRHRPSAITKHKIRGTISGGINETRLVIVDTIDD